MEPEPNLNNFDSVTLPALKNPTEMFPTDNKINNMRRSWKRALYPVLPRLVAFRQPPSRKFKGSRSSSRTPSSLPRVEDRTRTRVREGSTRLHSIMNIV